MIYIYIYCRKVIWFSINVVQNLNASQRNVYVVYSNSYILILGTYNLVHYISPLTSLLGLQFNAEQPYDI